jgi:hypothetical protein
MTKPYKTPIKRQWTLRIHSNNDGGGYIYSGDDVSYPEDDYLKVISADWVEAEINKLKTELAFYKNGTQIKEIHYDEHLSIELAESNKQVQELVQALEKAKTNFNDFIEPVDFVCSVKELEKACKLLAINAMRVIDDVLSKHKLKS